MSFIETIIISDFNPDALEARDVKEEYDSDPSDTGSSDDEGSGSGSEGEKEKRRKVGLDWCNLNNDGHNFSFVSRRKPNERQRRRRGRKPLHPVRDPPNPKRRPSFQECPRNQ